MELPELPEPDREEVLIYSERFDGMFDTSKWFTADQMRSYGLSCARAAMEMAAQIAEDTIVAEYEGVDCYGDRAAAAIRAEMSTPNTAKLDNMAARRRLHIPHPTTQCAARAVAPPTGAWR